MNDDECTLKTKKIKILNLLAKGTGDSSTSSSSLTALSTKGSFH